MQATDTKREQREWWAYCDGKVARTIGYSCGPENPQSWWCPDFGSTLNEGFQLFNREDEALRLAIRDLSKTILDLTSLRARHQQRLVKLG